MLASLLLAAIAYVSPVHYPIELAGNFGEPRPNHFHAGIDVKTDRMTGKPLYAMADGFISKVSVGTHGFGKAVYVRHPDGNTSVYVHLDDFAPQIEAAVKRYQYAHKVYATDITFPATMMPVHKGQFIGFSGNTGSSRARISTWSSTARRRATCSILWPTSRPTSATPSPQPSMPSRPTPCPARERFSTDPVRASSPSTRAISRPGARWGSACAPWTT